MNASDVLVGVSNTSSYGDSNSYGAAFDNAQNVLAAHPEVFAEGEGFIQRLAYADRVTLIDAEPEDLDGMVCCATADAKLYIPLGDLVDVAKELERIAKELEKARKNLTSLEGKLSNEKFVSRAPEAVVAAEREKADRAKALIAQLEQSKAALEALKN